MNKLTHVSLFSGIGGLDLAAEAAGFETVCQCEWADYPYSILQKHWPDVPKFRDITTFTKEAFFEKTGLETITILSGGFPCQPFSLAGKRRGTEDDRYLWPAMLDVIRTVRPRWVVGENVLGIVNWSNGLVFEQVCADLEAEGYEVQPYVLPACGVNAPHQRYRTWFVAHAVENSDSDRCLCGSAEPEGTTVREFGVVGARGGVGIHIPQGLTPDCADAGAQAMPGAAERSDAVEFTAHTDDNGQPTAEIGQGLGARDDSHSSWPFETVQLAGHSDQDAESAKEGTAADTDGKRCDKFEYSTEPNRPGQFGRSIFERDAPDFRSGMPNRHGTEHTLQLNDTMAYQAGMVSRLNPLFVEEMMGFPTGWILTPFLRDCPISSVAAEAAPCVGEPSPSNATVMPSSHKSPTESC